jgi:hypothetical protein
MNMSTEQLPGGTVHELPADVREALTSAPAARVAWESLTPLARNEWICWTISVKQADTRQQHIERLIADLQHGKRRPCCWMGCIHRTDKPISPSVQGILDRRSNDQETRLTVDLSSSKRLVDSVWASETNMHYGTLGRK